MVEIVRWISLVLLWIAMGINVWATVKANRLIKKYQNKLQEEITNELQSYNNKQ